MTDPPPDGFDLLAAILRPKMPQLVDVACAKIILSMLGIHVDKPGWVSQWHLCTCLFPRRHDKGAIADPRLALQRCITRWHTDPLRSTLSSGRTPNSP